jgi:hypothetical protein
VSRAVVGSGGGGGGCAEKSKVSFELEEADFAQNQAVDPYAHKLVELLASALMPISLRVSGPSESWS